MDHSFVNRELQDMLEMGTITNLIKGQRIQCLRHTVRWKENKLLRAALEWILQGKRLQCRHRKRWFNGVEGDLMRMGIENWKGV